MNAPDELALLRAELAELRDEVRALRARELSPRFAAIYPAFEDRFRGTEADVRERLAVYLPEVRSCVSDAAGPRVLDLGPGRGEWLQVLADAGVPARGVDDNPAMVEHLRGRGLDVAPGDAAEHLAALPDGKLDAVTAFHVVEHLDLESTLALLAHTARVLRPGGLLVLETPHPANLVMGVQLLPRPHPPVADPARPAGVPRRGERLHRRPGVGAAPEGRRRPLGTAAARRRGRGHRGARRRAAEGPLRAAGLRSARPGAGVIRSARTAGRRGRHGPGPWCGRWCGPARRSGTARGARRAAAGPAGRAPRPR